MSKLAYIETASEVDYLSTCTDYSGIDEWVFNPIKRELERLKDNLIFYKEVTANIYEMIKFVEKNIEICSDEKVAPIAPDLPGVTSSVHSELKHQNVVNRLLKEHSDEDSRLAAMEREYELGKLTPYEMDDILRRLKNKS